MSYVPSRRSRLVAAAVSSLALAGAGLAVATQTSADAATTMSSPTYAAGRYVVMLKQPGAASYHGGKAGYRATSPSSTGRPYAARSASAQRYTERLATDQRSIARNYGAQIDQSYTVALNGFSTDLSSDQAASLAKDNRVLAVTPDSIRHVDSWAPTSDYFGMTKQSKKNPGLWKKYAGSRANAGSGVVIADLDTGIWPEAPSFRGKKLTTKDQGPWDASQNGDVTRMEKADGTLFTGQCQAGAEWAVDTCTTKIISARAYGDGYLAANGGTDGLSTTEFVSPRDGGGHGSHTASTAAGEQVSKVKLLGTTYRDVVGMAPGATLAVYKVCWSGVTADDDGCVTSDMLAAIDDVIADNADVINFSIGGSAAPTMDPVEVAFEGAAEAGIFVSASAGNSGPDAITLDHAGPWTMTVGASNSWSALNTVKLGNGVKVAGASLASKPIASTPLVASVDAALPDADPDDADLCDTDTLDPAKVTGKIVVCKRGVIDRTAKSEEVKRAGGIAMVLVNPSDNSINADAHVVPTINLNNVEGDKVRDYLAQAGDSATASFVLGNQTKQLNPIPAMAPFSSRGPTEVANSDILKPDIAAPGVDVLAAVAPPSNHDRSYDFESGTSMAAPHISGLAAFILGEHPKWTPSRLKSAMMMTATDTRDAENKASSDVFAQGAGEVSPKRFFDPGLFIESSPQQWRGFLAAEGYNTGVAPLAAGAINQPSFAEGAATGPVTFTRTFRASKTGTWKIALSVPGFTLTSSPSVIRSKRVNDLITVNFTLTRTTAALAEWSKGYLRFSGPTSVRMPVAIRPLSVDAPGNVAGTGTSGTTTVEVTPGFTGALPLTVAGLTKADTHNETVAAGDDYLSCVTMPEGSPFARFDADAVDDDADIDLYVYTADSCDPSTINGQAGVSGTASGDERVDLVAPAAGTYIVDVNGYAPGASGDPIPFRLDNYVVDPSAGLGGVTATPNPVAAVENTPTQYVLSWTGLDAGARYLGTVSYQGALAPTVLTVDTGN